MMPKIIVTEGKTDSLLLERVLTGFDNLKIKTGSGYSSALSLASSILIYHKQPVLLLLDADSNEPTEVADRYEFVRTYLKRSIPGAVFKVILFEPELEKIFFEDATVTEHLIGRPLAATELQSAQLHPKRFLQEAKVGNGPELIAKLQSDDIERLNQLGVFKEIKSFLQFAPKEVLVSAVG
jgi:hypothetical protein